MIAGAVALVVLGLLLAGAAASVGVAAATVSQLELTRWVQYRLRGAHGAAELRENPGRFVAATNALTVIGLIAAAAALPGLLAVGGSAVVRVGTILLVLPVCLVVAYLAPRFVGRRWAERIVAQALPWAARAARVLGPVLPPRDASARSALAALLSGAETHVLSTAGELAVVSGVLAFTDRPVRELMTPRTGMVAIPEGMLVGEAAHVFAQSGYSRFPVYRQSLDEVVGVAYAIDLLQQQPEATVPVRPALLVPATTRTGDVLREMQRGHGHLAVVLDEFGGTAGLVTFDDLLRTLVAELFDEPAGEAAEQGHAGVVELDGGAAAAELEVRFGAAPQTRDVQTIGGLLAQRLGRIPRAGERFVLAGLEFDVLQASATRVGRVAVRRAPVRAIPLDGGGEPT